VIQNHASNSDLSKKSCIILRQLLKESEDPQLPSRILEAQCSEALQLMIETEPEKDDETKQLVLEILNYLFKVKGVLHKIVAKNGKGILKMFMNTGKSEMARAVIECLKHTASEGLEELGNQSLPNLNKLVQAHQNDIKVCQSGSEYIKNLFENSSPERIKECGITSRDIIRSFGPYNMDDKIFRNIDVAIDILGTDEEFYSVLSDLLKNPSSDDFWIMSHLVDRPSLDIEGKKDQLNSIIKLCDANDLVKSLNSEVCFFLMELNRARPGLSKELLKDKSSLIKKIMDEIDNIKGPYKFMGLKVLQQNIDPHGSFMRENDIIKKAENWMKNCESPEDMKQILDFLGAFCDDKNLKNDMLAANLHRQAMEKVRSQFPNNAPTFEALQRYLNKCVEGDDAVLQFCESGSMEQTLNMAAAMTDTVSELEGFMQFTTKVLNTPKAAGKLAGAFDSTTKLFCTLFEKRIADFFNKWYTDRGKKEVWATNYRPKFLENVSTESERDALRKAFATYNMSKVSAALHAAALGEKGFDTVNQLAQHMATVVCFMAKDDPDTLTTLNNRELIDEAIASLKNNIEFINDKTLKSHIIARYMALFCTMLPLFHQKAYVKKVSNKKSDFCYLEFTSFIELACARQPTCAFYTLAAFGLYSIPNNFKPERPQISPGDEEEHKDVADYQEALWTPLTFILAENPIVSPINDALNKTLKKKSDPLLPFAGYISLALAFQFGNQDKDLVLESQLVSNIISMVNDDSLDPFLATSAIYSLDCCSEASEKAIIKLNSLGSYDKLLRFMNNLRNQDILKHVISSLLQKLANSTDGHQLEYDLERLVKKCKDYDEQCASKGDSLREDILNSYNELSGLLQIAKAQQYCLNKSLQETTLNTLTTELKRDLDDLVSKGLIVNYQDFVGKLLDTNILLFQNAKSKPDDHRNVTSILQNVLAKWRNDPAVLKDTLELVKCCIRKKGQLELNAHQSKDIHNDLISLQVYYKNDSEICEKIRNVIELLDLETEKEVDVITLDHLVGNIDQKIEKVEEPEVYEAPHTESIIEQENEQKEMQEGFVTEEVFATAQETIEKDEEKASEIEEKKVEEALFQSDFKETTVPETTVHQDDDLNLRIESDRNRLYNALCKKGENPTDSSQDAFIAKGQNKLNELEIDELELAIFFAKWVAKSTSVPQTTDQVGQPGAKLKTNLERFNGHLELLKFTCSASASMSKSSQNLLTNTIDSDLIGVERNYLAQAQQPDPASVTYFCQTLKHCAFNDDNRVIISQKGVVKVITNALPLFKDESEGVIKAILHGVNAICGSKVSCPMNTEVE
jgi:hypothetical protein